VSAERIVEANTYSIGDLIGWDSGGSSLATNADRDLYAIGVVVASSATGFLLHTQIGQFFRWPSHGLGSSGDELWLGTAGAYLTSQPSGSSVLVVQKVAKVIDANNVQWMPPPAVIL